MDAVAIRLGMWDWGLGFTQQYFGVPYVNFWAWFWVVFSFSLGLRLLGHASSQIVRRWAPLGALFGEVSFGTSFQNLRTTGDLAVASIAALVGYRYDFIL